MMEMQDKIDRLTKEKGEIAKEFEQAAAMWMSEKGLAQADRVQQRNDLQSMARNLDKLMIDAQSFEAESYKLRQVFLGCSFL